MGRFITLTEGESGQSHKLYASVAHIRAVRSRQDSSGAALFFGLGPEIEVQESPDEVAAMIEKCESLPQAAIDAEDYSKKLNTAIQILRRLLDVLPELDQCSPETRFRIDDARDFLQSLGVRWD